MSLPTSAIATVGGGCFWCVEAVFTELQGVEKVESGYAGGAIPNPSYQLVCTGMSGHAEVVQITYNPQIVSYKDILSIFFTVHDPTTLNRQGNDEGTQYRSVIFYHDEEQRAIAQQVMREVTAAQLWDDPLVTELSPLDVFYKAETYHQDYYKRNSMQPYCLAVVAPKVYKFRKAFAARLKT